MSKHDDCQLAPHVVHVLKYLHLHRGRDCACATAAKDTLPVEEDVSDLAVRVVLLLPDTCNNHSCLMPHAIKQAAKSQQHAAESRQHAAERCI